jgi:hypothetical protein
MAQISNAFTTSDAQANREALSDVIANIDPTATPFMSSIGTNNVDNVTFSYQNESLGSVSATGEIEGFEVSRQASIPTVRVSNVCQINSLNVTISGSQEASNSAGKSKGELAHQMALASKRLKRNMETALCQNQGSNAGSSTQARATRSFESFIATNVSKGTGGANGTATAGRTDGTQRALSEALFKDTLELCFQNGAEPSIAIAGAHNKQVISGFTGRANTRSTVDANTVENSISVYAGDFGTLKIMPSNRSRDRSVLFVDSEYAKVSFLRNFQTVDLSTIGDATSKLLLAEFGLTMHEQAHGLIADLLTA